MRQVLSHCLAWSFIVFHHLSVLHCLSLSCIVSYCLVLPFTDFYNLSLSFIIFVLFLLCCIFSLSLSFIVIHCLALSSFVLPFPSILSLYSCQQSEEQIRKKLYICQQINELEIEINFKQERLVVWYLTCNHDNQLKGSQAICMLWDVDSIDIC